MRDLFAASNALKERYGRDSDQFSSTTETLTESGHATLALTRYGPVLGVPVDAMEQERTQAREAVEAWNREGRPNGDVLVLPWPVDVTDLKW